MRGTVGVQWGYSGGTVRGYSEGTVRGTARVQQGYSEA